MTQKTTAESFFEAIKHIGAGSLYYLTRKGNSNVEFIFEPLVIDTRDKELTIKILQRAMNHPNFIAFPGTPEANAFMTGKVEDSEENK